MRRISSGWTFFYKRIFPVIWVGFLAVFAGIGVVKDQDPFAVIVPLVMIAFGYFLRGDERARKIGEACSETQCPRTRRCTRSSS
jgi:hypothetical protein